MRRRCAGSSIRCAQSQQHDVGERDASAVGGDEPGDHVDERGLAGA
jgi:hypothetical protein